MFSKLNKKVRKSKRRGKLCTIYRKHGGLEVGRSWQFVFSPEAIESGRVRTKVIDDIVGVKTGSVIKLFSQFAEEIIDIRDFALEMKVGDSWIHVVSVEALPE